MVIYFRGQVFAHLGVVAGRHVILKEGGEGMGLVTDSADAEQVGREGLGGGPRATQGAISSISVWGSYSPKAQGSSLCRSVGPDCQGGRPTC